MPEENGNTRKEVSGTVGRVRRGSFLSNGLSNGADYNIVSLARPLNVSATTGRKSIPADRQAERWEDSFHLKPTWMAWPGLEAASSRVCSCRGKMPCPSRAAGRPQLQLGRKMSASLESELVMRFGISFDGAKAAH